jgi:hypothetical protein
MRIVSRPNELDRVCPDGIDKRAVAPSRTHNSRETANEPFRLLFAAQVPAGQTERPHASFADSFDFVRSIPNALVFHENDQPPSPDFAEPHRILNKLVFSFAKKRIWSVRYISGIPNRRGNYSSAKAAINEELDFRIRLRVQRGVHPRFLAGPP